MPATPPVLRPSLIPFDVLQDVEREAKRQTTGDDSFDGVEPRTSPIETPEDMPVLTHVPADPEVGVFALSQVALFRDLPVASLEALAAGAMQVEIPDGELLFVEGEDADSFYVVVDGTLEILRQKDGREVALRHAARGEALGLFGLFSAQLRTASARAIGDCTVVEVSGTQLQQLLNTDDALHAKLMQFHRERLLEGFMASKLFADIDSIARARLIGRFSARTLAKGDSLLNPGEVSNLIAVVTHGTLILEDRPKPGQAPKHFEVTSSQFLAVTCAMSGLPGRLRIFAPGPCTIAILTQKDLHELLKDYTALRALPARLPQYGRQLDRDVFCGATGVPGL
jgi:hypothetical protein